MFEKRLSESDVFDCFQDEARYLGKYLYNTSYKIPEEFKCLILLGYGSYNRDYGMHFYLSHIALQLYAIELAISTLE